MRPWWRHFLAGEFARLDASGQDRELVHGYAAHILKTFTATKTTPHGAVGELIAKVRAACFII
jgi:hypothetical protein